MNGDVSGMKSLRVDFNDDDTATMTVESTDGNVRVAVIEGALFAMVAQALTSQGELDADVAQSHITLIPDDPLLA